MVFQEGWSTTGFQKQLVGGLIKQHIETRLNLGLMCFLPPMFMEHKAHGRLRIQQWGPGNEQDRQGA